MKSVILILSAFLTINGVKAQDTSSTKFADNTSIVGVWQNMPTMEKGWSNTYLFFPDGTFKFFYSQMDCAKRDVSYSGLWNIKGDALRLTRMEKVSVVGGELQKSDGSCASDFMIVGGVEKKQRVKKNKREVCSVSDVYKDEGENPKDIIYIDAIKFWRFSNNPDEVLNNFEK